MTPAKLNAFEIADKKWQTCQELTNCEIVQEIICQYNREASRVELLRNI